MIVYDSVILAEPSLAAYWLFGAEGISDRKDGNTGTYQGTVNAAGNIDSFNGADATFFNGGYVSTVVNYGNIQTYTLEMWFKTSQATPLITGNDSGGSLFGNTDRGMYVGTNGLLYYNVFPGGNVTINGATDLRDSKWHYAAATLNQSTSAMRLYTDGAQVSSTSTSAQGYSVFFIPGAFKQGGRPNAPGLVDATGCYLSRVAIYTSELSPATISTHYATGAGTTFSVRDPQAIRVPGIN